MENSLNYSLEIKKAAAWCNGLINIFVNLPTHKTLDITDENNNTDVFSSNHISNFDISATDNIIITHNNVITKCIVY